ncbi:MAG: D-alanyl-D-alanine carboxypeptidase family protein [Candidatus Taylorbacteria bacterium]
MINTPNTHSPKNWGMITAFAVVAAILISGGYYVYSRLTSLSTNIATLSGQINSLEARMSSTTASLQNNISQTSNSLNNALNQQIQSSAAIAQQLGNYQQQVSTVSTTVSTLQKLSKTDSQLLEKYSKVFFLNEYYAPAQLVAVPNDYSYSDTKVLKLQNEVWPHLKQMIDDAKSSSVTMYVFSAYRSFNEQSALKSDYKITYGAGTANSFSADQGYSEHQLGTTIDMIAPGLGGILDNFGDTKQYTWLINNAYRYGFVISYPKNNTFYVYEPWHWRFVGIKLATDLHNQGKNFYDLDQRTIDTYLVNFFDAQ